MSWLSPYGFAAARLGEIEKINQSYLEEKFGSIASQRRAASIMLHIFGVKVYSCQRGSADRMREGLSWLPRGQEE